MAALTLACALLFILQFRGIPRPITVVMEIRTERCAQLRLQYDVPTNAAAPESALRMIDSWEKFRTLRIPINASAIRNIRLLESPGRGRLWLRR